MKLKLSVLAYNNWCDCFGKNTYRKIINFFISENNYEGIEGTYNFQFNDKNIIALIRNNKIINFIITHSIGISTHAYNRWRERIGRNDTNKDINIILGKLLKSYQFNSGDGKYLIDYKGEIINLIVVNKKIITFIKK